MNRSLPLATVAAVTLSVFVPTNVFADGTRLLRDPDVSENHIAFVHANDIWLTGRNGGDAFRLTSGEGGESDPVFSPDGKWVAFTGQYGGNPDVYVVSVKGGEPKRLTFHPGADIVQSWTADGEILFQSGRAGQPTKLWQFYRGQHRRGQQRGHPVYNQSTFDYNPPCM